MALPSRKQQIEAVAKFLDSERNEGRSLDEIAASIVDGYLDAVTPPAPVQAVRPGMLLKTITSNKVYRVSWMEEGLLWAAPEAGGYGWMGSASDGFWGLCEEYRPKRRTEVDGKNKMVEMTDEEIAEAWLNPNWKVGDQVSQNQREFSFEIIATAPQSVLMRRPDGRLNVDSNKNLEAYYRRESKPEKGW